VWVGDNGRARYRIWAQIGMDWARNSAAHLGSHHCRHIRANPLPGSNHIASLNRFQRMPRQSFTTRNASHRIETAATDLDLALTNQTQPPKTNRSCETIIRESINTPSEETSERTESSDTSHPGDQQELEVTEAVNRACQRRRQRTLCAGEHSGNDGGGSGGSGGGCVGETSSLLISFDG
jgi:hypothetical protein